jgi:hypothetical protein
MVGCWPTIATAARSIQGDLNKMTKAADQARAANAHFLRARVSVSDSTLMEMVAGFAVLASAVEALAVQLGDMEQDFSSICEKLE